MFLLVNRLDGTATLIDPNHIVYQREDPADPNHTLIRVVRGGAGGVVDTLSIAIPCDELDKRLTSIVQVYETEL